MKAKRETSWAAFVETDFEATIFKVVSVLPFQSLQTGGVVGIRVQLPYSIPLLTRLQRLYKQYDLIVIHCVMRPSISNKAIIAPEACLKITSYFPWHKPWDSATLQRCLVWNLHGDQPGRWLLHTLSLAPQDYAPNRTREKANLWMSLKAKIIISVVKNTRRCLGQGN